MQTLKECFSHEPTEKSVFKKKKLQKKKINFRQPESVQRHSYKG